MQTDDDQKVVAFSDHMPAAPEAEKTLLGSIFTESIAGAVDAPSLRAAIAEGISTRHFQVVHHRIIFAAMKALLVASLPVDLSGCWQQIAAEHGEVEESLREASLKLAGDAVSSLHVRVAVDQLKKAEAARQQTRAAVELVEAIKSGDEDRQREARRQIAMAGQHDTAGLPRIVACSDLIARECPTPPVLIAGILHRGAKLLLGGGSKSFKSWSLIDLALSIAAGVPFWGMPTTQGKVLFLNFEIPEAFFRGRLQSTATAKGLEVAETGKCLDLWTLRGHATDLAKLVPHIVAQAAGRDYSLIILDPIYKCLGDRDENAAGDIAELLNEVEALAVRTGAAIVIAHHFAKGSAAGKDSKDRMSGSGVWARDPDALITLTAHENDGAFSVDFTLRNFAPRPAFCVRWDWPLMRPDTNLDPSALKQAGRPKEHTSGSLLEVLPTQGATFSEWKDLGIKQGMSDWTFKKLCKELKAEGRAAIINGLYCRTNSTGNGGSS
jgi:hypothetical protein